MRTRLLRVPEVAEILGLGRTTIYSLIKSGALPSVRVAGCRRIAEVDLDEYLDALRGQPASGPDQLAPAPARSGAES